MEKAIRYGHKREDNSYENNLINDRFHLLAQTILINP